MLIQTKFEKCVKWHTNVDLIHKYRIDKLKEYSILKK